MNKINEIQHKNNINQEINQIKNQNTNLNENQNQIQDTSDPFNQGSKGVIDVDNQKVGGIGLNFSEMVEA